MCVLIPIIWLFEVTLLRISTWPEWNLVKCVPYLDEFLDNWFEVFDGRKHEGIYTHGTLLKSAN